MIELTEEDTKDDDFHMLMLVVNGTDLTVFFDREVLSRVSLSGAIRLASNGVLLTGIRAPSNLALTGQIYEPTAQLILGEAFSVDPSWLDPFTIGDRFATTEVSPSELDFDGRASFISLDSSPLVDPNGFSLFAIVSQASSDNGYIMAKVNDDDVRLYSLYNSATRDR